MAHTLSTLLTLKKYRITLLTSNKAAALTMRNPQQQSGQEHVCQIYKLIKRLRRYGNQITILQVLTSKDNRLLSLLKSRLGQQPKRTLPHRHRFPECNQQLSISHDSKRLPSTSLPEKVGKQNRQLLYNRKNLLIPTVFSSTIPYDVKSDCC